MTNSFHIQQISSKETLELRHSVMWPNKSIDFVKLPKDEEGNHFGVFKNKVIVSVVSLFIDGNKAQFRKLATDHSEQGKGYASKLLTHTFEFALEHGVEQIWCNARKDKIAFYEKLNMIPTEKEFKKEGIDFVILNKALV